MMKKIFSLLLFIVGIYAPSLAHAVSCGDTITSDTVLTADLLNCPGTGLNMASGPTLDCAGHTISGAFDGREQWGIRIDTVHDVQVRNCRVTGFLRGVRVKDSNNVRVQSVRSYGNGDFVAKVGYGMSIDTSDNVLVPGGTYSGNADEQIHIGRSDHVKAENVKMALPYFNVGGVLVRSDREQFYALDSPNVECLTCQFGPGKQAHRKTNTSIGILREVVSYKSTARFTVKWTQE
jgi:hypothetical protein